ncbi:MAG: hypothetical protein R2854_11965 [Caldilineaceae bacterium]
MAEDLPFPGRRRPKKSAGGAEAVADDRARLEESALYLRHRHRAGSQRGAATDNGRARPGPLLT